MLHKNITGFSLRLGFQTVNIMGWVNGLCVCVLGGGGGVDWELLKGQYHAIFSNTLKIEKTLFG